MNIADVLMPASQKSNLTLANGQEELNSNHNPLFALLLESFGELQMGAEEQAAGESAQKPDPARQDSCFPAFEGQGAYAWILQNLIPAGMEANSGSHGDLNSFPQNNLAFEQQAYSLSSLINHLEKAYMEAQALDGEKLTPGQNKLQGELTVPQIIQTLKKMILQGNYAQAFEPQGTVGSTANSLDPTELDNYIRIIYYLQKLSGKIGPGPESTNNSFDRAINAAIFKGLESFSNTPSELGQVSSKGQWSALTADKSADNINKTVDKSKGNLFRAEAEVLPDKSSLQAKSGLNLKAEHSGQFDPHLARQVDSNHTSLSAPNTDLTGGINRVSNAENPAEADPIRIWAQVVEVLKKQNIKPPEVKQLSIQLRPAELGEVKISLKMENGRVHLTMVATEQATSSILQNSIPELRNGLSQAGIPCGDLEMGSHSDNQKPAENRENRQHNPSDSSKSEEGKDSRLMPVEISYFPPSLSGSRINLSA